jgi:hypothetical protein
MSQGSRGSCQDVYSTCSCLLTATMSEALGSSHCCRKAGLSGDGGANSHKDAPHFLLCTSCEVLVGPHWGKAVWDTLIPLVGIAKEPGQICF